MSHVTTSAVVSTTGSGRFATLPQTQLASNERFHDFLESYVHPEKPAHATVSQKASINRSEATKAASFRSEEKTQNQISKPTSALESTKKRTDVSVQGQHSTPAKQAAVTHKAVSGTPQKNTAASSSEQAGKSSENGAQKAAQSASAKSSEKYSTRNMQPSEKSESEPGLPNEAADEHSANSASSQENVSTAGSSASGPEEASKTDSSSSGSTIESFQGVSGAEISSLKETAERADLQGGTEDNGISVSDVSPSTVSTASTHMDSAPSEKISTASETPETSDTAQAEKTQPAVDDEEQVARHGDQQPLLYQKSSDGNTTTHIEMNVGVHEKVHVEIAQTTAKEQRIHINTDNPEVYQSLKNDRDTLLASLTASALPVTASQPVIPADIQISLSQPSFLDMSSRDERQGGNNQSSGHSRGGSSSADATTPGRRLLRGVVDLTV